MHQVLANLLENAVRYTGADSARPTPSCESRLGHKAATLWLEVADRGPGLPPGEKSGSSRSSIAGRISRARTGTGLGLAICRGIVELHGGTITARNRPGGGAVFQIELPQPQAPKLPPLDEPLSEPELTARSSTA